MRRTTLIALVLSILGNIACSSSGGQDIQKDPKVGEACNEIGETACSVDSYDRAVVVVCAPNASNELTWRTTKVCEGSCSDAECVAPGQDVKSDQLDPQDIQDSETTDADVTEDHTTAETVDSVTQDVCDPNCEGKVCGDDGCGGSCGECGMTELCIEDGAECCQPDCEGKACGEDGCGGVCGECPGDQICNAYNLCAPPCEPKCGNKECGPDGCGGSCGDCPVGSACDGSGKCSICVPNCAGKECGEDGCGGVCGGCPYMHECVDNECQEICVPNCVNKECGDDGCGDSCGECPPGESCSNFQCVYLCDPDCEGKECGQDGCGGNCGKCPPWAWCTAEGTCETDCVPNCVKPDGVTPRECGSDGCGGSCGTCPIEGHVCSPDGSCLAPDGPCESVPVSGWCDGNFLLVCISSMLTVTNCDTYGKNVVCEYLDSLGGYGCNPHGECVPDCEGKFCGDDGCGGSCGDCPGGQTCEMGQCVGETDCGTVTYAGCCSGNAVLWCDNGALWHMDCNNMQNPSQQHCGWNSAVGFYDCIDSPVEGPPNHPYLCGGACIPDCTGKQCGDDGCGGSCGECPFGLSCTNNVCTGPGGGCGGYSLEPVCQGDVVVWCEDEHVLFMDCQTMGDYFHCGWVPDLYVNWCYEEECIPQCENKECGEDGCGYTCGYCPATMFCNDEFQCVYGSGFCGDIDYVGVCEGNQVNWCQNGVLQTFDCESLGPTWQCGWFEDGEYYWCIQ